MSEDRVVRVACAAEGGYDVHSAVLLHSAAANVPGAVLHAHYLHGPSFPPASISAIRQMLEGLGAHAHFHELPDARVAALPSVSQFTPAMWYRIFLPELVEADRILYLDADAVVSDSLIPLWEVDLEGCLLGAVRNVFQANHLHRPESLGLAGPDVYFNSGVLLMDLSRMREEMTTKALFDFASGRGEELEWPDQDTLNVVLKERWHPLHPRWNVMNSMRFPQSESVFGNELLADARARPAIRHFEGPGDNKPWVEGCDRDDRDLYFIHRRGTPWPTWELEAREERAPGSAVTLSRRVLGRLRAARTALAASLARWSNRKDG